MRKVAVPPLDDKLTVQVLGFLGCRHSKPGIRALDHLVNAYVERVPWESVFRILKRQATSDTNSCPRLPTEFWRDALEFGGGGTCYEDNFAFMSLLSALGYSGYMTVNDLGGHRRNHAAGVIILSKMKYVVDVSIPIPRALPLNSLSVTRRSTPLHTFHVTPLGKNLYQISRTRHPKPSIYILIDKPTPTNRFLQVITDDYGPNGQFLEHVIIVKMINGTFWRYNQGESANRVEGFGSDGKKELEFSMDSLSTDLGTHFSMDASRIGAAIAHAGNR